MIETERYNLTSVVKYTGVDKKKCKKILAGRQTKRPSMYIVHCTNRHERSRDTQISKTGKLARHREKYKRMRWRKIGAKGR